MKDKDKIIGLLGAGLVGIYLFRTRNKAPDDHQIEGFSVNLNPEKVIDSSLNLINMNPALKGQISNGLKGLGQGLMNKKK